jgi:cyclic lactone autoinducer peptide
MADYTWPFPAISAYAPEGFDEAVEFNVELTVARSGKVTTLALPGGRWRCTMNFPDTTVGYLQQRRQLEAFLLSLRGGADRLLLWNLQTPLPLGNMRGAPTLAATVAAGASTALLAGCRAGNNLIATSLQNSGFMAANWTLTNATITANAAVAPDGTSTAWSLNRTAAGNHFAIQTVTVPSTASRTVTFSVWLKAGTLTGNVVLRIRDGAGGTDVATLTVTPTSTWTLYRVSGTFGAGSAANAQLYIDPANDAGSAGDTLLAWVGELNVASAIETNCIGWFGQPSVPAGLTGASDEVRRTSASNAFMAWYYGTSAHAGKTYTFSIWLRAGTFSGTVNLLLRDGASTQVGIASVTLTATWTRYSVTGTFGASPAADIYAFVDQAEGGAIGETFFRYLPVLNEGSAPADSAQRATLLAGDRIAFGGQRVVLTADAVDDTAGLCAIQFQPAHRAGAAAASAVTLDKPTTKYVLTSPVVQMPATGSDLPGFGVELVEE